MTEINTDLAIERWPIERLRPDPGNARTHSDEQIAQIVASMRTVGWTNPILVDEDGLILAGHGRLDAARQVGLTVAPVVTLRGLTPAQKRLVAVADNKIALNAGWDEERLAAQLREIIDAGLDLDATGFNQDEVDDLMALLDGEGEAAAADDDAVPETPENPVTRSGDVWVLGRHRLLCGDATSFADVERVLDGALADMAFTDPPYNVDYEGKTKKKLKIENDAMGSDFLQFLRDACSTLLMVTKGACYVCMSSSELHTLHRAWGEAGGKWSTFIIWAKHTFTLGRADYQRQYEPILYGWKAGSDHFWCGARDQGDVWNIAKPAKNDIHPTMKPVELVERAIRNSSKSRDIVLDTFGGSGTTMIAAEKTGRSARLVELDPRYCDVIVQRWQEFTKKAAVLADGGLSFDQARRRA